MRFPGDHPANHRAAPVRRDLRPWLFMLGQVYEKLGNNKQARAHYRKFLDLWKNADPGLPEVEDTKNRLASL
jgi:cytochrome c-type biogenesis protein CcmH/NrfG